MSPGPETAWRTHCPGRDGGEPSNGIWRRKCPQPGYTHVDGAGMAMPGEYQIEAEGKEARGLVNEQENIGSRSLIDVIRK